MALLNEVLEHVPDDARRARRGAPRAASGRPADPTLADAPVSLRDARRLLARQRAGAFRTRCRGFRGSRCALGTRLFDYWARNYWPWELRALVERAGFRVIATDAVWQTFENISGHQPRWLAALRPLLRALCGVCERIPGLRAFGVSQVIVAMPA